MKKVKMIAAIAENNGIGYKTKIPWHLPEDFKLFKETTLGNVIIMGLTTYQSIGKPLPGRHTIVLSLEPVDIPGVDVALSIPEALAKAEKYDGDLYVCGGASVYRAFIDKAQELLISHVKGKYEADTFFPKIEEKEWAVAEEEPYEHFTFKRYVRRGERQVSALEKNDKAVYDIIQQEKKRQREGLEMIPSESFASLSVLEALGSCMNNKYSEGYPGKRYYGGNEHIDEMETLAIERAKKLFGAEHVNVQPYSGSPGNLEIYFALLEPGDTVLGMSLSQGGHLTHGHKVNASGKWYHFIGYGVDPKTETINLEEIRKLALEHKPKMIIAGYTAYPRIVDFEGFAKICNEVGAYSMADISHIAGLIAGGVHPSPFPHFDVVMTTTHKTLCGPRGAIIMCKKEDRLREKYHPDSKLNLAQRIDKAVFPGMQGGPHNHQIAAKAVAFGQALKPEFKVWAAQVVKNTKALAESMKAEGIRLVSGGSDNHLVLADLTPLGVTGAQAEAALDKAGITVNKNTVPYDKRGPFDPSGIRLGTPALTNRGMTEKEMSQIGKWIGKVVKSHTDEQLLAKIRGEVKELCKQFPLYE